MHKEFLAWVADGVSDILWALGSVCIDAGTWLAVKAARLREKGAEL